MLLVAFLGVLFFFWVDLKSEKPRYMGLSQHILMDYYHVLQETLAPVHVVETHTLYGPKQL